MIDPTVLEAEIAKAELQEAVKKALKERKKTSKAEAVAAKVQDTKEGGQHVSGKVVETRRSTREPPYLISLIESFGSSLTILGPPREGWTGERLRYNEMTGYAELDGQDFTDDDVISMQSRISTLRNPTDLTPLWISKEVVLDSVMCVARRHSYHPAREYLAGLPAWDGVPRCSGLLGALGGKEEEGRNTSISKSELLSKFLIGSVARIRKPGCKFQTVLILRGLEGEKKTSALQVLYGGSPLHSEIQQSIEDKDFLLAIHQCWCAELGEMQSLLKTNYQELIKQMVSKDSDPLRRPYARVMANEPRSSVMAATTNEREIFRSAGRNRRYWIVEVVDADLTWISANRDQLWAEAVSRYSAGERYWLETAENDLLAAAQSRFEQGDLLDEVIEEALGSIKTPEFKISDVYRHCFPEDRDMMQANQKRLASRLRAMGYDRMHARTGYVWEKVQS